MPNEKKELLSHFIAITGDNDIQLEILFFKEVEWHTDNKKLELKFIYIHKAKYSYYLCFKNESHELKRIEGRLIKFDGINERHSVELSKNKNPNNDKNIIVIVSKKYEQF